MNKNAIGKKLLQLRGNRTREEVARELGISISALQMYENGQRIPRDEIKVKIADYYNSTVQYIFFDDKQHNMCGYGGGKYQMEVS